MMTPEYASPEQVRGETLGTTSDIYSLGVLLYELLCGCGPYRFAHAIAARDGHGRLRAGSGAPSARVAARTPGRNGRSAKRRRACAAPRSIGSLALLDGDLDGIVLMAMRKEPARRYASADMLRQDVERHLAGLPVLAHRGSRRYRVGKFLRRHRVEAAAAAMVLIAALVAGLSVAVSQGRRAARERDRAERALAESNGRHRRSCWSCSEPATPATVPAAQLTALDLLQRGALRADDLVEPADRARRGCST